MIEMVAKGATLRRAVSFMAAVMLLAPVIPATAGPAAQPTPVTATGKDQKIVSLEQRVSELETETAKLRVENYKLRVTIARQNRTVRALRVRFAQAMRRVRVLMSRIANMFGPWRTARASWYGPGFYGHSMAGGPVLRPGMKIFAHKTMRFGTKVQFSYHGKTVVAVAMDRGPYIAGREFDLGPGTARALGFDGVGTVKWRVVKR